MPYQHKIKADASYDDTYIMTHGKWTIMGNYSTPKEAQATLDLINDAFVMEKIKTHAEREMHRFWPKFKERFSYLGWKGAVLAKPITDKEFRTALTFRIKGIIHVIPGKISHVIGAEDEVSCLLNNINIKTKDGCDYVDKGVLSSSKEEIKEKPLLNGRNTASIQTYKDIDKIE
jgi:hypothetical protein